MEKFIWNTERKQPRSVYWKPHGELKYPSIKKSGDKWLIFTQASFNIKPNEGLRLDLKFGYMISEGGIFISPAGDLKLKLGIMNNVFIDHDTPDIQVYIYNFTKTNLFIPENSPFCYVQYLKA